MASYVDDLCIAAQNPDKIIQTLTATETYPKLVFFTLKKIKGFCTLIKKSSTSEKN